MMSRTPVRIDHSGRAPVDVGQLSDLHGRVHCKRIPMEGRLSRSFRERRTVPLVDFEALSGRESTMDPVLEDILVELLVDLPADVDIPIVARGPQRTWIWSDLHLSAPSVPLGSWGRPFRNVEEMNRHLLQNWRRRVGAGDTIIWLGDVAHPMAAGVTDELRDMDWLVGLVEARDSRSGPRGRTAGSGRSGKTRGSSGSECHKKAVGSDPPPRPLGGIVA